MGLSFENSKGQDKPISVKTFTHLEGAESWIGLGWVHMNRGSSLHVSGDRDMAALTDCKMPGKWGMKIHRGGLAQKREGEAVR